MRAEINPMPSGRLEYKSLLVIIENFEFNSKFDQREYYEVAIMKNGVN